MEFKLKSGNCPEFKHIGSSPAKQSKYQVEKAAQMQNASHRIDLEEKQFQAGTKAKKRDHQNRINAITGTPLKKGEEVKSTKEAKTKVNINQKSKTDKQKARGGDTPGGRRITRQERDMLQDSKLNEQLARANTLEAAGKGERGFSWKELGMSVLRGEGLLGNIDSGMGKGKYKSEIIKDKQTKIAGKKERKTIATKQKDERKAAKKLKNQSMVSKIKKASNLNTDILDD